MTDLVISFKIVIIFQAYHYPLLYLIKLSQSVKECHLMNNYDATREKRSKITSALKFANTTYKRIQRRKFVGRRSTELL